ncbi:type 4a pilus biogenesis protein PilO [Pectinatus frisingensis]|uniref:type 4a pilus biogenesis protein PilO n=1 Tax=Pectinatus frisingensis TaxID=865 RepID=UPI0015F3ACEF|nr:type 4a pilus biogenesis protein PilO [Pectinatus frisingensis]
MVKQDKYNILITIIAMIIWNIAFYYLLYSPGKLELQQLHNNISVNQKQITDLKTFAADHDKTDAYAAEIFENNIFWENKLPNNKDEAKFIADLQSIANKNSIRIIHIAPAAPANKLSSYHEIPIQAKVQGNYFQLLNFLHDINESPRYNIIEKMSLTKQNNELEVQLLIKIFSLSLSNDK